MTNVETDIALIKKDIESFTGVISRLDVAIEKITKLSSDINQLVLMHSYRIDMLEKYQQQSMMDEKELKKELEEQIKEDCQEILEELKKIRGDYNTLDGRMKKVERLFWVITGAATVIGFIISMVTDHLGTIIGKWL